MDASPRVRTVGVLFAWCVLSGCHAYRPPNEAAPHAMVSGSFAGGSLDRHKCVVQDRGYEAHVTVCEGRKQGRRCKAEVFPYILDRTVTFRVPLGREITINPYGVVGFDYQQTGNEVRMRTSRCDGEPFTIVPRQGVQYRFIFSYDEKTQECSATWSSFSEP